MVINDWHQVIGCLGAGLYLLSYFLLQTDIVRAHSATYIWMNICAASSVMISLFFHFNLASLIIQLFWIAISLVGLYRRRQFQPAQSAAYQN